MFCSQLTAGPDLFPSTLEKRPDREEALRLLGGPQRRSDDGLRPLRPVDRKWKQAIKGFSDSGLGIETQVLNSGFRMRKRGPNSNSGTPIDEGKSLIPGFQNSITISGFPTNSRIRSIPRAPPGSGVYGGSAPQSERWPLAFDSELRPRLWIAKKYTILKVLKNTSSSGRSHLQSLMT